MKIRQKLLAGFTGISLLTLLIGGFSVYEINKTAKKLSTTEAQRVAETLAFYAELEIGDKGLTQPHIEKLQEHTIALHEIREQDIKSITTVSIRLILVATFGCLIAASSVGILIAAKISQPLLMVKKLAQKATQEANFDIQVPINTKDEVGDLSISLNLLIQKVKELFQEKEVAKQAKNEFLTNMSHKLRTPMNTILGYTEILQKKAEDIGQESFLPDLHQIRSVSKHLLSLIDNILDLSKVEAGKMEMHLESFEISSLVKEVVSMIKPLNEKHGNTVVIDCPSNLAKMYADRTRVRQSLFNLLSNACKFTENGQITLSIEPYTKENEPWISFAIEDTGIGMDKEQMQELFKAFYQADSSTNRKYSGTGLKLALTKQFSQMMGGEINVQSELGKGSTFTIHLPVQGKKNQAIFPWEKIKGNREFTTNLMNILVIDDDRITHNVIKHSLSPSKFSVISATNGTEGLHLAQEMQPDVIFLDVIMPGIDGWEVLGKLKENPQLADIPVIMVTTIDEKNYGYALGATEYLLKPFNSKQLATVLERIL
ncbi:Histidine kinase (fragment) [Hyella patelloides LEGE 07179]|uniref:Circadian input-output histidine kinase CikA n=1 Tax=Hyella patelloides LEGE 07179 TaxID=945734 RepID=A0A563VPG9_9CYAN